jgi:HPt (histidine-containing phosphotransfer) domain-containing protein
MKHPRVQKKDEMPNPGFDAGGEINVLLGLQRYNNNWKSYGEILELFCHDMESTVSDIRQALDAGSLNTFAILLRGVRIACDSIGAEKLSESVKNLEAAVKAGDAERIRAESPGLIRSIETLAAGIRAERARPGSPVNPETEEPAQDEEHRLA